MQAQPETNVSVRVFPTDVLRFIWPEWDAYSKPEKLTLLRSAEAEEVVTEIRERNTTTIGMHETIPVFFSPETDTTQEATHMAFGDAEPSPSSGDRSLANEVGRLEMTDTVVDSVDLISTVFVDSTELNGETIEELGVFTGPSGGSNVKMLNHAHVTPNVAKDSTKTVTVDVTLTWSN